MQPKHQGFTLLEVLIALFIFTLIAFMLTQGLHTVMNTQASTEAKATQLTELQMAWLLLSRDLEQAVDSASPGMEASFIGDAESFTVTVLSFSHQQRAALQRSRYHSASGQLFRDTWNTLNAPPKQPQNRCLLTGIKQVYFRYLDHNNVFHRAWPPTGIQAKLPRAVEMNLRLTSGGNLQQTYLLPEHAVPHEIR